MDLVRLESYGTGFAATVSGRFGEGNLAHHDLLDGSLEVWSGFVSGATRHIYLPEDLDAWADVLDRLEAGQSTSWLAESGRTAEVYLDAAELDRGLLVVTVDEPLGARAKAEVVVDVADGWITSLRHQLTAVREAFPSEVEETSPGVYVWRNR